MSEKPKKSPKKPPLKLFGLQARYNILIITLAVALLVSSSLLSAHFISLMKDMEKNKPTKPSSSQVGQGTTNSNLPTGTQNTIPSSSTGTHTQPTTTGTEGTSKPTMPTEPTTIPTIPTEPTTQPTIPTEPTTAPTTEPSIPTEPTTTPSIPGIPGTENPSIPTEPTESKPEETEPPTPTNPEDWLPPTGDSGYVVLYAMLAIFSAVALVVVYRKKKALLLKTKY